MNAETMNICRRTRFSLNQTCPPRIICLISLAAASAGCVEESPRPHAAAQEPPAELVRADREFPRGPHWLSEPTMGPTTSAISADGRLAALKSTSRTTVYDLHTGQELHSWPADRIGVQFSMDGRYLLARRKVTFELWQTNDFQEVGEFSGRPTDWKQLRHSQPPVATVNHDASQIAVSNSRQLFDQSQPESVILFDRNGRAERSLKLPKQARVFSLQYVGADRLLGLAGRAAGGHNSELTWLWNTNTGEVVLRAPSSAIVKASDDNRWIGVLNRSAGIPNGMRTQLPMDLSVYSSRTGEPAVQLRRDEPVRDFCFRPDGERLLICVDDQLYEYDTTDWQGHFVSTNQGPPIASVAYSPGGTRRFATVEIPNGVDDDVDHHLRAWDAALNRQLEIPDFPFASYNGMEKLYFFPEGDRFLDCIGEFKVRDVLTGATLQTAPQHRAPESISSYTRSGRYFLTRNKLTEASTGRQRIWHLSGDEFRFVERDQTLFSFDYSGAYLTDVAGGVLQAQIGPEHATRTAACSADGKVIVQSIRYYNDQPAPRFVISRTDQLDVPCILPGIASALAVAPNGKQFAAANAEGIAQHDITTGLRMKHLWKPPGRVLDLQYSPDGAVVLAVGVVGYETDEGRIAPDADGWAAVYHFDREASKPLEGHLGTVRCADFSSDGLHCVTGGDDGSIRLWNVRTARCLHEFKAHQARINDVAYSPLNDRILAAADDGTALHEIPDSVSNSEKQSEVAGDFKAVEGVNAWNGHRHKDLNERLFPLPENNTPAAYPANWQLLQVGKANQLTNRPSRWLKRARNIRQIQPNEPTYDHLVRGYELRVTAPDQDHEAWVAHSYKQLIVRDADDKTLFEFSDDSRVESVSLSRDGRLLSVIQLTNRADTVRADSRFRLRVFDIPTGNLKCDLHDIAARYSVGVTFAPNHQTMLLQVNNFLELRDIMSGQVIARSQAVEKEHERAELVDFSADGEFIISGQRRQSHLELRNSRTLEVVSTLNTDLGVEWIRHSPSGKTLLVGQPFLNHRILLTAFDTSTWKKKWCHAGPASADLDFSADEKYMVSHSSELWALWNLQQPRIECVIENANDNIANRPVFSAESGALHLGYVTGPLLWSPNLRAGLGVSRRDPE